MSATDNAPDPAPLLKLARQALSSSEFRRKYHLADFFGPNEFYEPQLKFFADGAAHHQRLLRGGNQVGKSFSCAFEASLHLSGKYPRWWKGKRFDKPTRGWIIGPTVSLCAMVRNDSFVPAKANSVPALFRFRSLRGGRSWCLGVPARSTP